MDKYRLRRTESDAASPEPREASWVKEVALAWAPRAAWELNWWRYEEGRLDILGGKVMGRETHSRRNMEGTKVRSQDCGSFDSES